MKGAALQEDGRPDPGAVMDGEMLDIKYKTRIPVLFPDYYCRSSFPFHIR
jgi:hypothetical protein